MFISIIFYIFSFFLLSSALMVISARNPVHSVLYLIFSFFNAAGIFILLQAEFIAMILIIVYVGAVAVLFLFVVMMLDLNPRQKPLFLFKNFKQFVKSLFSITGFIALFITFFLVAALLVNYILNHYNLWLEGRWEQFLVITFIGIVVAVLIPSRTYRWLATVVSDLRQNASIVGIIGGLMFTELTLMIISFSPITVKENFVISPLVKGEKLNNTKDLGEILYTDYIYLFQIAGLILLVAMIGAIVLTYRRRLDVKRQDVATQFKRNAKNTIDLKKVILRKGL